MSQQNGSTSTPPITKAQPRGGRSLAGHSGLAPARCPGPAGCRRTGFSWPAGFLPGRPPGALSRGRMTCSDLQRGGRLATRSAAAGEDQYGAGPGPASPRQSWPDTRGRAALAAETVRADRQATKAGRLAKPDPGEKRITWLVPRAAQRGPPAKMTPAIRDADTRPSGGPYLIGCR
jgi:hypothetical protein